MLVLICLSLLPALGLAQQKPYAAINRDAVSYNGPGRDAAHDLAGPEIRLGLLAPLAGPRQAEGQELRRAAEMAIEEENAASLPGGLRLALAVRDETGPWGRASSEIVHLVFDDQAVALITSTDGGAAHLAEQVANKIGVPILTLSSDTATTEINLPWLFRMGPTDAVQARVFARDIYQNQKLQHVALLTQDDHDGRAGGEEFEIAARELNAASPQRIIVEPDKLAGDELRKTLEGVQALVIWTDAPKASLLVARLREDLPMVPLYLSRKAAQGDWSNSSQPHCRACASEDPGVWTTQAPEAQSTPHEAFAERYRQRFGVAAGIAAAQAYDAVRMVAQSLRQSGPNRARLRDALAGITSFPGASGVISFDHAGNDTSPVTLFRLN
ncbi:MAG: ABC transporter substrate-binding protein [Terriglobia bacterium]